MDGASGLPTGSSCTNIVEKWPALVTLGASELES